jgi:16S rRNA (guanine527-N7)-methyltransferase
MKFDKMIQDGLDFFDIQYNENMMNALCFYALELQKWNTHINLTGLKEVNRIVSELFYDTFFLNNHIKGTDSVLDMGSGAGILAIPIKILNEDCKVFSLDKSLKKIQFQRHIRRVMHLKDFIPIHSRAEAWRPIGADTLIVKGFGSIAQILGIGERHIRTGGHAVLLKGKNENPVGQQGFELENTIPYALPVSNKAYRLFIYRKV